MSDRVRDPTMRSARARVTASAFAACPASRDINRDRVRRSPSVPSAGSMRPRRRGHRSRPNRMADHRVGRLTVNERAKFGFRASWHPGPSHGLKNVQMPRQRAGRRRETCCREETDFGEALRLPILRPRRPNAARRASSCLPIPAPIAIPDPRYTEHGTGACTAHRCGGRPHRTRASPAPLLRSPVTGLGAVSAGT